MEYQDGGAYQAFLVAQPAPFRAHDLRALVGTPSGSGHLLASHLARGATLGHALSDSPLHSEHTLGPGGTSQRAPAAVGLPRAASLLWMRFRGGTLADQNDEVWWQTVM